MTTTFDQLLAENRLRVYRAALGFMRDEQDALDQAQESLLKAVRAKNRYDPDRPFYPWLYRIVRNTCLDAIARRKSRAMPGLDTERVRSEVPNAPEVLDAARKRAQLAAAMQHITEQQREIINLRHFQGLSYAEIGEILGIPEGTVMSRLYRARKALARRMAREAS